MAYLTHTSPDWKKRFIILPHEVIEPLYSWHGGQYTAVYSLASTGSENLVSPRMIRDAIDELELTRKNEYKRSKNYKELTNLIGELDMVLSSPYEFSAKEAGMDIEEDEYEYSPNPNRPPKHWWQDCVAGVGESAASPESVCGSLWFHKMSESQRRHAVAEERKDNPTGTAVLLGVTALLAAGAWWLFGRDTTTPAPSAGTPPGPSPGPLPPAATCVLDPIALTSWGVANKLAVIPLLQLDTPPDFTQLQAIPGVAMAIQNGKAAGFNIVSVTKSGTFYDYDAAGNAVQNDSYHASYCAYKNQQAAPAPSAFTKNVSSLKGPPSTWLPAAR